MTVILEIAIVYIIFRISQEILNATKVTSNNQIFKIGLTFYIFSIFPIIIFVLYASAIAFTILLGLLGIYFYLKSEKTPKDNYYSIFFLTLCILTSYLAIIWLVTIILFMLRKKSFKTLIFLIAEFLGIFFLISLPWLINNSDGFLQSLFYVPSSTVYNLNKTIWCIGQGFESFIPILFALVLIIIYTYFNYDNTKSLDLFLINFSIGLVFSSFLHPWSYLWIFPIISIKIAHSFRKYFRINLMLLIYLFIYYLILALLFLIYPDPLDPNPYTALIQIISFGETVGIIQIFIVLITPIFQFGLIYLIWSYSQSRTLNFILILSYGIFYTINFLIWLGAFLY